MGLNENEGGDYPETPVNPGATDGKCANYLECGNKNLTKGARCFGCGFTVCDECDTQYPMGSHVVVAHWEEF